MTEQLKPCPFCGGKAVKQMSASNPFVYCESCDANGPECDTIGGAVEFWNTRPSASREIAVKPLEWSDISDPDGKTSHYTHVTAETPLGPVIIEWKGWKDNDSPICNLPWPDGFVCGDDLDHCKQLVREAFQGIVDALADTAPGNTDPIAKDDELRKVQGGHERVKHIKRGSTYRVIGAAKVQTDRPLSDYAEVVIYQGETDGHIWARPVDEFEDPDRFESLPTEHPTEQPVSFDFRKFEREEATEQPSVRDAALIRSRAIKEFCEAAGIKASVQVAHLPDDVRRVRAQAALDQKLALRSLAQEGG